MEVHFTEMDKHLFLAKRGYKVTREVVESFRHIHGSRFETSENKALFASKDGRKQTLDEAFHQELKTAILEL